MGNVNGSTAAFDRVKIPCTESGRRSFSRGRFFGTKLDAKYPDFIPLIATFLGVLDTKFPLYSRRKLTRENSGGLQTTTMPHKSHKSRLPVSSASYVVVVASS